MKNAKDWQWKGWDKFTPFRCFLSLSLIIIRCTQLEKKKSSISLLAAILCQESSLVVLELKTCHVVNVINNNYIVNVNIISLEITMLSYTLARQNHLSLPSNSTQKNRNWKLCIWRDSNRAKHFFVREVHPSSVLLSFHGNQLSIFFSCVSFRFITIKFRRSHWDYLMAFNSVKKKWAKYHQQIKVKLIKFVPAASWFLFFI